MSSFPDSPAFQADALDFLFESNPLPTWVLDPQTLRFLAVNRAAVEAYGYSGQEFLAMRLSDLYPAEDLLPLIEPGTAAAQDGEMCRHLRKDGRVLKARMASRRMHYHGREARMDMILDAGNAAAGPPEPDQSAALSQSFWDSFPDPVRVTDAYGRVVRVNEAYCRLAGMTRAELEGRPYWIICPYDEQEGLAARYQRVFAAGTLDVPADSQIEFSLGGRRWLELVHSSIETASGKVVVTICRDASANTTALERLQATHREYLQLFERIPDPVLIFDSSTRRFIGWNAWALRTYGYSTDELRSMQPMDLHPEAERELVAHKIGEAGPHAAALYTHLTKDGRRISVEVLSEEVVFDGQPARVCIIRDITSRVLAERRLKESERRLQTLMSNLQGMAYRAINDSGRTMLFVSDGCRDLTGYSAQELLRRRDLSYATLIRPDDKQDIWERVQESVARREPFRLEYRIRRADGREVWVWEAGRGICSESGEVLCIEGLIIDITEQKQTEALLEKARVASEAASRAKSQFLANMSHEIRTPMNGILGLATLALSAEQDHERGQYLSLLKRSAEGLMTLLNDVLDLSKLEAGHMHLEHVVFSVEECVRGATDTLRAMAHSKDLELSCRISDRLPRKVIGDPVRVRQVLLNLIANAIKFTSEGAVRVVAEAIEGTGPGIRLSVQDTGIGIPTEFLSLIFEPFRQADDSMSRRYGGTGLGLAITSQLVKLMGGLISVESQPGAGSTFSVEIEFESAADGPEFEPPEGQSILTAACPLSILLAEDNPVNQLVACRLLEKLGHRVTVVGDGRRALEAVERDRFDLVLMDIQMPDLDGTEATQAIRAREAVTGRHLPIIALTAHALKGDEEKLRQSGMDGYVAKPISLERLSQVIQEVVLPGKSRNDGGSAAATG